MPIANGKTQPVFHPFAENDAILVIHAISKLVRGLWTFVTNRINP
jgi:hypothetical protein